MAWFNQMTKWNNCDINYPKEIKWGNAGNSASIQNMSYLWWTEWGEEISVGTWGKERGKECQLNQYQSIYQLSTNNKVLTDILMSQGFNQWNNGSIHRSTSEERGWTTDGLWGRWWKLEWDLNQINGWSIEYHFLFVLLYTVIIINRSIFIPHHIPQGEDQWCADHWPFIR
jgi:hypothetical protein